MCSTCVLAGDLLACQCPSGSAGPRARRADPIGRTTPPPTSTTTRGAVLTHRQHTPTYTRTSGAGEFDMTDQGTVWLTQEAHDKLRAELADLKGPRRQEIIEKISAARDEGDLKENSGYHAAKDEQGKQEARIRQLEDMLRRAEVGETPPNDGVVEPGMVVTVKLLDFDEEEKFLLGARENLAEGDKLDVYSPQSAMGAAINGKSKGETVTYEAPNGK